MQILDSLHHLDGIILATLVAGAAYGAKLGIVRPLVCLACSSISAYVSAFLHGPVAEQIKATIRGIDPSLSSPAALAGTFVATYVALFVASALIRKVLRLCRARTELAVETVGLRPLDRLAGAAVGFALAGLLSGAAVIGLAFCPGVEAKAEVGGSKLRPHVAEAARMVLAAVPERSRAEFETALRRLERAGTESAGHAAGMGLDIATDKINDGAEGLEQANRQLSGSKAETGSTAPRGTSVRRTCGTKPISDRWGGAE